MGRFFGFGFILQLVAIVHWIRRRPETYWLWIIIFFGPLGALVYIGVEMIPDLGLALKIPKAEISNKMGMEGMHWDPAVFDLFWSVKWQGDTASLTITKQPPV